MPERSKASDVSDLSDLPTAPGGPPASLSSPPSLLFLYSQVPWDDVWQRPQEMAVGLARHRPVLFFSPVQVTDAAGRLAGKWEPLRHRDSDFPLTIACPRLLPGEYKSALIRAINRRIIAAEACRLVRLLFRGPTSRPGSNNSSQGKSVPYGGDPAGSTSAVSPTRPIPENVPNQPSPPGLLFLTNSPFCDSLPDALHPSRVIYDIIDDFAAFDWAPPDSGRRELNLLRRADFVFTGTQTLYNKKVADHPRARFVACGVDFERFASGARQTEPPDLAPLPRPILGYMGTLSDRLDRDLLLALAHRFPQASLVLIGPVHGSFGPPLQGPNVHHLGLRPPEALPAYAARFDVALMPFAQTEAARAINPVKTLEYLAARCPVVSTPIPDVERFFSDVVVVAPAVEPFLGAVERLLHQDQGDRIHRGVDRARTRSWQAMADEMESILHQLDPALSSGGSSGEFG
jgi:glycosyltransferase involved in cell wall biosynthesis